MPRTSKAPIRNKSGADAVVKKRILQVLKAEFRDDTVDVSDGYMDNIHLVVVSRKFDGMRDKARQEYVWSIIDKSSLTMAEKGKVSLILAYSPADLK